jgi:malate/lactate dehydrogenase
MAKAFTGADIVVIPAGIPRAFSSPAQVPTDDLKASPA